jgi:hypothetical protein
MLVPSRAHPEMHMRKLNGASGASWNDQVAHLMSREGMPRDKARDRVILDSLKRGDCNVLAALLMDGHVPAPNVRFALALMLLDNEEADAAIARHYVDPGPWWLPYRLVIKTRPAKPRRSSDKITPERRVETHSGPIMPDLAYEAAIARLDQAVRATDTAGTRPAAVAGARAAGKRAAAQRRPGAKRKR